MFACFNQSWKPEAGTQTLQKMISLLYVPMCVSNYVVCYAYLGSCDGHCMCTWIHIRSFIYMMAKEASNQDVAIISEHITWATPCGTLYWSIEGKFQARKKKCVWISKYPIYRLKPLNPIGKSCQPYEEPGVFSSAFNGRGSDTGWPPNLTFKTVPAMTHNLMRQMGPISGRLGGMSEPQGELTARKDALKRSRRTCSRGGEGF